MKGGISMKIPKIKDTEQEIAKYLNAISDSVEVFMDQHGEPYAKIKKGKTASIVYLSTLSSCETELRRIIFEKTQKIPQSSTCSNIFKSLQMFAVDERCKMPIERRVCFNDDTVYYDLDNKAVVKVTSKKVEILENFQNLGKKFNFVFPNTSFKQETPEYKSDFNLLEVVKELFNVDDENLLLFTVYLVSIFFAQINHPILVLTGEHGAAKSTAMRLIQRIIDPSAKDLFVLPDRTDDLITVLSNNHFVAFDNISSIKTEVSNILCQAVTNGSLCKRKLFTDNEEVVINIRRVVALNGIALTVTQTDLIDRALIINFKRITEEQRLTEAQLNERFNKQLPNILGSIFHIIKNALKLYSKVELSALPRMADFAMYGYCIAESIGKGMGEMFLESYSNNNLQAIESAAENSPVISAILELMAKCDEWSGTAAELLAVLKTTFPDGYVGSDFPKSAQYLSQKINIHTNDLMKLGVIVDKHRGKQRVITLRKEVSA